MVVEVTSSRISVQMEILEACSSCSAKSVCGNGGSAEQRIVSVKPQIGVDFKVGDKVLISMEKKMGYTAVLFAYVFPFVILMATLLGLNMLGVNEITAGLISLSAMFLYFAVIMSLRKRIETNINFKITKQD